MSEGHARRIDVTERPQVPWLSVVFGYGPMLPFVAGACGAWMLDGPLQVIAIDLTLAWAIAILSFLAGVRRGLSFRTEGGPTFVQIATMFALFCLALGGLFALLFDRRFAAAILLLAGYVGLLIGDPLAARQGEAPLFFARLRPWQMSIAVASLAAVGAAIWRAG